MKHPVTGVGTKMEIDWQKYQRRYYYRLLVSLHYLGKQSETLKQRVYKAWWRRLKYNLALLSVFVVPLLLLSAPTGTYGVALVAVGAIILAWTAFRVHEKQFRESALVSDDRVGDTPYQERVSITAMNYVDAAMGVAFVALGFSLRVVTSLSV
jgi:hypothetical protein